jgi:hypothetical protein
MLGAIHLVTDLNREKTKREEQRRFL